GTGSPGTRPLRGVFLYSSKKTLMGLGRAINVIDGGLASGIVMTVRGPIEPLLLGFTLTHEHLFMQHKDLIEPTNPAEAEFASSEITMAELSELRYRPFSHRGNLRLTNPETAYNEVSGFVALGGGAVVDVTPPSIGRDAAGLRAISDATGAHI